MEFSLLVFYLSMILVSEEENKQIFNNVLTTLLKLFSQENMFDVHRATDVMMQD